MTGDEVKIYRLWQEMIGDPSFVQEDLSGVWPVRLGSVTEELNLDWYERKYGTVTRRGEVVVGSPEWMAATLDGWCETRKICIECKHVGGRESFDTVRARYQPQLHWQGLVTKTNQVAFSVIVAANEPLVEFIDLDPDYSKELMTRAASFMLCVETLTPPVACPAVKAPIKAEKIYDMRGSNYWASAAPEWMATKAAARMNAELEKELKAAVPADAAKCFGYGVQITRDRAGRLSLKEVKE